MEEEESLLTPSFQSNEEELKELVRLAKILGSEDGRATLNSVDDIMARFSSLLLKYTPESQCLDPKLVELCAPFVRTLRHWLLRDHAVSSASDPPQPAVCRSVDAIWRLMAARGVRVVLRFFPHGVPELAALHVAFCEPETEAVARPWRETCLLARWLSLAVMLPFALQSIHPQLVEDVVRRCQFWLSAPGPQRDASADLLGRLLSRSDAREPHIHAVLESGKEESVTDESNESLGRAAALFSFLRHASRSDASSCAPDILRFAIRRLHAPSAVLRLYVVKLVQRVALVFLPVRPAPWSYQRGNRSIQLESLPGQALCCLSAPLEAPSSASKDPWDKSDREPPRLVDDLVDVLLEVLFSEETNIRWSSAKGLGRIAARLPRDFANDLTQELLLRSFKWASSEEAWHGGLLALAEMAQRGVLLPDCLPEIVAVACRGLLYEERMGARPLGRNVRDAACYLCWAMPRACPSQLLVPHFGALARSLVLCALFDRNVNGRRAAAAALQEGVGRLGHFPDGMALVERLDFFDLATTCRSYLELAPKVAAIPGYARGMLHHLATDRCGHWNPTIRDLAAHAFQQIAPMEADYVREELVPVLQSQALLATDASIRSGSTWILALLRQSLPDIPLNCASLCYLDTERTPAEYSDYVAERVPQAEARIEMVHAFAGDLLHRLEAWKMACLACLLARIPRPDLSLDPLILAAARRLLASAQQSDDLQKLACSMWVEQDSPLSLGAMLPSWLDPESEKWLQTAAVDPLGSPERRRDALYALGELVSTFPDRTALYGVVFSAALNDTTRTRHGDVGSWARLAALRGILHAVPRDLPDPHEILRRCLRLSAEPLEILRPDALQASAVVAQVLGEELVAEVCAEAIESPNPYGALARLLCHDAVRDELLFGWALSAGGRGEAVSKTAYTSLVEAAQDQRPQSETTGKSIPVAGYIGQSLVRVWNVHMADEERTCLPILRTVAGLLDANVFSALQPPAFALGRNLLALANMDANRPRSKASLERQQLLARIVVALMGRFASPVREASAELLLPKFLLHNYPAVRVVALEHLYTVLLMDPDAVDLADSLLSISTDDIDEISGFCKLLKGFLHLK